jgi:hypothetical protein
MNGLNQGRQFSPRQRIVGDEGQDDAARHSAEILVVEAAEVIPAAEFDLAREPRRILVLNMPRSESRSRKDVMIYW